MLDCFAASPPVGAIAYPITVSPRRLPPGTESDPDTTALLGTAYEFSGSRSILILGNEIR